MRTGGWLAASAGLVAAVTLIAVPTMQPVPATVAPPAATEVPAAAPSVDGAQTVRPASPTVSNTSPDAPARQRRLYLDQPRHGTDAIEALGEELAEVAARNAMTEDQFRTVLEADSTFWLGRDGRAFYIDTDNGAAEDAGTNPGMATYPNTETFKLHSLPGSNHTIFLDFDGITLGNTYWSDSYYWSPPLSQGFYSGYIGGTVTNAQHAFIQTVWRIVAEKYATFDVDVTTQDPGPGAYNRTTLADQTYGAHVVITPGTGFKDTICAGSCTGIALVGTFNDALEPWYEVGYYQPAWVFTNGTNAVLTANIAAHEVGHQLALHHDGNTSATYYPGHNNWAPVMGLSTTRAVTQFDQSEYPGATRDGPGPQATVDDFATMSLNDVFASNGDVTADGGGLPRRSDTVADTIAAAAAPGAPALGPLGAASFDGIIETRSDIDVVRIEHQCSGDLHVTADGIGDGGTLDIALQLLDSDGTTVASNDPPSWTSGQSTSLHTGMNAAITTAQPPGTYYARVDGVGRATPTTGGYSDYGSVGQYRLSLDGCVPATPTDVTATRAVGAAGTVSWTAPPNAASTVAGYRITGVPGGPLTAAADAGSIEITGLTPNTHYDIGVVAHNTFGDTTAATTTLDTSTWQPTSAPTVTATVVDTDVTIAWAPPPNDGGATLGDLTITVYDADDAEVATTTTAGATAGSWHLSAPLASGVYRVSATLESTADEGDPIPVGETTFVMIGSPTDLATTTFVRGAAELSWTPPAGVTGYVTGYRIDGLPGGPSTTTSTSTPLALPGGASATVTVTALAATGESLPSTPLTITVPTWQPTSAPTVTATVVDTDVTIAWAPPANDGGATLGDLTITVYDADDEAVANTTELGATAGSWHLPTPLAGGVYRVSATLDSTADEGDPAPAGETTFAVVGAPSAITTTAFDRGMAVLSWTPPTGDAAEHVSGYRVDGLPGGPRTTETTSLSLQLPAGGTYPITVTSMTDTGESLPSEPITITVPTWRPATGAGVTVSTTRTGATVRWTEPANPGAATLTGWQVTVKRGAATVSTRSFAAATRAATFPLTAGNYTVTVQPSYSAAQGAATPGNQRAFAIRSTPTAPRSTSAKPGKRGKPFSVAVTWPAPTDIGNSALSGYRIKAVRVGKKGKKSATSALLPATKRTYDFRLPKGKYKFQVIAVNAQGNSPASPWSRAVTAR